MKFFVPTIRRRQNRVLSWGAPWLVCALVAGVAFGEDATSPEAAAQFENEVRPILAGKCFQCHGGKKTSNGLRVDSREALLTGGESGPALVAGQPEQSLLVEMIRGGEDAFMPPDKHLAAHEVAAIERWIAGGAVWPADDRKSEFRSARHWAFQPVVDPAPPTSEAVHPIDRFIAAKLSERGIAPGERADPRTLIRRATFDLTGLPPTPEEVSAFLSAHESDPEAAFGQLVDRLLASPRYGERWGRYWMDLVRYADTAGDNADYPIPSARLYRDWIIDAFNADKPYDQFLREQLAGDVLAKSADEPDRSSLIVATTFIGLSRRYATEPYQMMHLVIEDAVDTTAQAMLGLTMRCARCHDHKFDPTTQQDYYALYGMFASSQFPFAGSESTKHPLHMTPLSGGGEAYAVAEGRPHDVALQKVGDPGQPGEFVPRGPPRFLCDDASFAIDAASSGRLEFARWLVRPEHPLTARVMVNRIWQHHFGKGIVATPSNFGLSGAEPTHPELLDWLAARFVDGGWSIKQMHRLIMNSQTYQRSSAGNAEAIRKDPANQGYWRFDRLRLDAEALRDAMLSASGELDLNRPGPHPFPPQEKWDFTQHRPFVAEYPSLHRSVYLMTQRFRPHSYLALFDGPDRNATTDRRMRSTVPLQSLYLMNNAFVRERASALARRALAASALPPEQVTAAYWWALSRAPDSDERERALQFVERYRQLFSAEPFGGDLEANAFAGVAKQLLTCNEFLYVD